MWSFIVNNVWTIIGVSGAGALLGLALKKVLTDNVMSAIGHKSYLFGYGLGVFITGGLAKWKYTKGVWNSIVEPYVLVFFRVILHNLEDGIISGLESDNVSK